MDNETKYEFNNALISLFVNAVKGIDLDDNAPIDTDARVAELAVTADSFIKLYKLINPQQKKI